VTAQSLIRRTMYIVLSAELLCAIAFSGTALWHERRARIRAFDVMLQGRSDSLLGAIQDAEDPDDNVAIDPIELKIPGVDVYAVYNLDGRLLGASKDAPVELTTRQASGFSNRISNGHGYRVLQRDAMRIIDRPENGGAGLRRPVTIVYATPTRHVWHEIFEAASFYAAMSAMLLAITAIFMVVSLRGVLRPIEELAAQAGKVSKDSLYFEAPESALQMRELAPLARTLSDTISSLRKAFENEQRFVGDAAHELKTAVAVVRSTIQVLMMRSRSQEEYTEGLDRLLQDNQRVEDLVARMLTLARMEQQSDTEAVAVDWGEVVRVVFGNLASYAEARLVTLSVKAEVGVGVRLSAEKAEVLVSNLMVNAIQHSAAGAEVGVEVERVGESAVMRIRDTGTGIAAEALPHIFERFYREDSSRSRETGGAGLGLAICKSIVQSAGGTISMESKLGVETVATVSFSLA
jgi:signal transduction histidine kinase